MVTGSAFGVEIGKRLIVHGWDYTREIKTSKRYNP